MQQSVDEAAVAPALEHRGRCEPPEREVKDDPVGGTDLVRLGGHIRGQVTRRRLLLCLQRIEGRWRCGVVAPALRRGRSPARRGPDHRTRSPVASAAAGTRLGPGAAEASAARGAPTRSVSSVPFRHPPPLCSGNMLGGARGGRQPPSHGSTPKAANPSLSAVHLVQKRARGGLFGLPFHAPLGFGHAAIAQARAVDLGTPAGMVRAARETMSSVDGRCQMPRAFAAPFLQPAVLASRASSATPAHPGPPQPAGPPCALASNPPSEIGPRRSGAPSRHPEAPSLRPPTGGHSDFPSRSKPAPGVDLARHLGAGLPAHQRV